MDYRERIAKEYLELKDKYNRLCSYLNRLESYCNFAEGTIEGLINQYHAMKGYLDALERRLAIEDIDLDELEDTDE